MSSVRSAVIRRRAADTSAELFTLPRAQRALVCVRPILRDVVRTHRRLTRLRFRIKGVDSPSREAERAYEEALDRLRELVDELHLVGVELRAFSRAEVDFPGHLKGRRINFTWRLSDPRICRWRDPEAVRAKARSLAELDEPDFPFDDEPEPEPGSESESAF